MNRNPMNVKTLLVGTALAASAMFLPGRGICQALLQVNQFAASKNDLNLAGDARIEGKNLVLTKSKPLQRGACWYKKQVNHKTGFETEFRFKILDPDPQRKGGDGFAFVLQNQSPNWLGGRGDSLGYQGNIQAIAMEFDTYDNSGQEGSKRHVSLSIFDVEKGKFLRRATVHEIPELTDGNEHFARISVKDGTISFFLDSYIFPILSSHLDFSSQLGSDPNCWIGFTSATSDAYATHQILSWNVEQLLPPADINEKSVEVETKYTVPVQSRKIQISVWDHNKIDGDIVSLKAGDKWLITNHTLAKTPKTIDFTLTGFSATLILYANNLGKEPPNTASISINDGKQVQEVKLNADKKSSEAIRIEYKGE